jgi:hypothetical protein
METGLQLAPGGFGTAVVAVFSERHFVICERDGILPRLALQHVVQGDGGKTCDGGGEGGVGKREKSERKKKQWKEESIDGKTEASKNGRKERAMEGKKGEKKE